MVQLYKIKFLKDTELCKSGDVKEATKKNADSYVINGYAEYIENPKFSAKDIENYIEVWAEDWNNPQKMIHIIDTMKEISKNSNYSFNDLKKLVLLKYNHKNENHKKTIEEEIKKKIQTTKEKEDEEKKIKEARWFSEKATMDRDDFKAYLRKNYLLDKGLYPLNISETGLKFYNLTAENYMKWAEIENTTLILEEDKEKSEKEEIESVKQLQRDNDERNSYLSEKINFNHNDFYDSWDKIKGRTTNLIKSDPESRLFFLSHIRDKIVGKAQLVQETIQKIPLISQIEKTGKDGSVNTSYKFIDDRYDARYDGYQTKCLSFDFWVYRVIDNGKEYFLFSQEKLSNEMYTFEGMKIELNNLSELTKTLRFRSLSTIFIVYKATPYVKIISKSDITKIGKMLKEEYNIGKQEIIDYLFTNDKDNKIYDFSEEYNLLQAAQLFSGKYEGYPIHIMRMGPVGTGKTTSLECLNQKFRENKGILEAGNSTPKALVPSFKEKPASPGYVLSCHRIGLIDELMKMIANANNVSRYMELMQQSLGQLNMLLEHKERTIGSGNDNTLTAKATAKLVFSTNPLPGRGTIASHVGLIDPTTLSRLIIWIQDHKEQEKVYKKDLKLNKNTYSNIHIRNKKKYMMSDDIGFDSCGDVFMYILLSIYDSLQVFISDFDENRVKDIFKDIGNLAEEPMRSIWRSRGLHHSTLILDGIIKLRCVFNDFDETFTAKEEDYQNLTKILVKMVNNWKTDLESKPRGNTLI